MVRGYSSNYKKHKYLKTMHKQMGFSFKMSAPMVFDKNIFAYVKIYDMYSTCENECEGAYFYWTIAL